MVLYRGVALKVVGRGLNKVAKPPRPEPVLALVFQVSTGIGFLSKVAGRVPPLQGGASATLSTDTLDRSLTRWKLEALSAVEGAANRCRGPVSRLTDST